MSASHRIIAAVFHAFFACGFAALSIALAWDGRQRAAYPAPLAFACSVAALGLGLMNARALSCLHRDRALRALPSRLSAGSYLQAIIGAALVAVPALRTQTATPRAVIAFFLFAAAWLFLLGFGIVRGQWLSSRQLVDHLGRAVPIAALSWFRLLPERQPLSRAVLETGDDRRILFRARLSGDLGELRTALRRAGLVERDARSAMVDSHRKA
jgi:hypothetical protein